MSSPDPTTLFDAIVDLPDPDAVRRYESLVGLDEVKERLDKQARVLLKPSLLDKWAQEHHGGPVALAERFRDQPPLFIFGGDVGTGKTTLAETFGDHIARTARLGGGVRLMRLSLNARGSGRVGEMTTLITDAFAAVAAEAPSVTNGDPDHAVILLIDEADALAQSREAEQMHHEDRAGVNALIRGIDTISAEHRPVITVLCTNRLDAIDAAIRRRAFDEFAFTRPDKQQRAAMLTELFEGVKFTPDQISALADLLGEGDRGYGFTSSDITMRLGSTVLLDAFPDRPLAFDRVRTMVAELKPTPPFANGGS